MSAGVITLNTAFFSALAAMMVGHFVIRSDVIAKNASAFVDILENMSGYIRLFIPVAILNLYKPDFSCLNYVVYGFFATFVYFLLFVIMCFFRGMYKFRVYQNGIWRSRAVFVRYGINGIILSSFGGGSRGFVVISIIYGISVLSNNSHSSVVAVDFYLLDLGNMLFISIFTNGIFYYLFRSYGINCSAGFLNVQATPQLSKMSFADAEDFIVKFFTNPTIIVAIFLLSKIFTSSYWLFSFVTSPFSAIISHNEISVLISVSSILVFCIILSIRFRLNISTVGFFELLKITFVFYVPRLFIYIAFVLFNSIANDNNIKFDQDGLSAVFILFLVPPSSTVFKKYIKLLKGSKYVEYYSDMYFAPNILYGLIVISGLNIMYFQEFIVMHCGEQVVSAVAALFSGVGV